MTRVIFRKFKDKRDIIALFPDTGKDCTCGCIMSYMHIGQHGEAYYPAILPITKLATQVEYYPLLQELESIGYDDLKICFRRYNPCKQ